MAEPKAVVDPVLETELRQKVEKGIEVHVEDIRQHLALACAGTGQGLQAAVHEVLQMDDGPARAEEILKLSTAQKSHVEAALMVIASKIERFRAEAQKHTEDAVKNMRQGRHVGPYILALIDTGASRHVVGEHNPRLAGFLSELDETDRPVFNQIDSNRIQSKGAAPLMVILPSLAADGRTARSASQTEVDLKISVLTDKAAKQMLVLSAGKLMRENNLHIVAEKTQRSVPASAGGGKWQQHEVYLVGDNGNAHHVRVYENNLFYIKLQLGAPGGVDVGAVADSIVRGASEIASEASSEATEALRACVDEMYTSAQPRGSSRRRR